MNAASSAWDYILAASPPISQHSNLGGYYEQGPQAWRGELQSNNYAIGGPEEGFFRPPDMAAQPSSNPQDLDMLNSPLMWQTSRQGEIGIQAPALDLLGNNSAAEACSVPAFPLGMPEGSAPRIDTRSENGYCAELVLHNPQQCEAPPCGPRERKRKRDSNWTKPETSVLVDCKKEAMLDNGSRFCKGKPTATNWDAISAEIKNQVETIKTGDQCRLRWDTLVKSYQKTNAHCRKSKKEFCELTDEERGELRLATTLSEDRWYEVIDQFCRPKPRKARAQKRDDVAGVGIRQRAVSPENSAPGVRHSSEAGKWCRKQVAIPGFNDLRKEQRSTLLDLVNCCSNWWRISFLRDMPVMTQVCEWLSIVQRRSFSDTSYDVNALVKKKLLHISLFRGDATLRLHRLEVYAKFVRKVELKNPDFDTHRRICESNLSTLYSFSLPLRITTLTLESCQELVEADLRSMPKLRYLVIKHCMKLGMVTGLEYLRELGWLSIVACTSLKTYLLTDVGSNQLSWSLEPELSQFVPLRRLEVWFSPQLKESGDLSSLKCLQVLVFRGCEGLSTISGLSGLHSLTSLDLRGCSAFSALPDLGQMKALVELDIVWTGVEEILGVDKLASLEQLHCQFSKLKWLPDLHHLPRLQLISLYDTPLIKDPSSNIYFGKCWARFNGIGKHVEHVEVSDISDSEHNHSECEAASSDYSSDE